MKDFRAIDISKQKAYDLLCDWIKLEARFTNPQKDMTELLGWLWKLKPPVPDPSTWLLPCGCGGVPKIQGGSIVCYNCGINVRCGNSKYIDHHDSDKMDKEIKLPWNTAMGYKEDGNE